jgi:molybdopterin-guanine dinucleotide biosynthesis protein A
MELGVLMITLAVLAGGVSSRMGRAKALVSFLGRPLVCSVLDRVGPLADEILLVADASKEMNALGFRVIPDLLPGHGPLGGLFTALSSSSNLSVIVVGCDMPFISIDLLKHQLELLESNKPDAVVPSSEAGPEPLHAIYMRETCLPHIRSALEHGERRMIAWFPDALVHLMTIQDTISFNPSGRAFFNINTPAELMQGTDWLSQEKSESRRSMLYSYCSGDLK